MNTQDIQCCTISCDKPLDKNYWDLQYQHKTTGWDIGEPSTPLKYIIDGIENKHASILIPGAGNAYEVDYLLQQNFTAITVIDISPTVCKVLDEKYKNINAVRILCEDFFEHKEQYDIILEQTFFCALPPQWRPRYVFAMYHQLKPNSILTGVLFNRTFEQGPPFGGSIAEYEALFKGSFTIHELAPCNISIEPRKNSEAIFKLSKKENIVVRLYTFEGITCNGCMTTVTEKIMELSDVIQATMSSDYTQLLVVSKNEIAIHTLQAIVSYDEKYRISTGY